MRSWLPSGRRRLGGYDSRVSTTQGLRTQPPDDLLRADASAVVDTLGRPLHDLRISVTDRCNFRCTYCMPKEIFGPDFAFLPRDQVLTFEEIERVARAFVDLGVEKLRITGGEPLVRRDLTVLIGMLAALRRPDGQPLDLTLTTNGSGLRRLAGPLRDAGLQRVTVSLDSLDDAVFAEMNGVEFPVAKVLDGIAAAAEAGLAPIKINMVVRRGINEGSIVPMARWARDAGHILRFIEYMDVGTTNGWRLDDVVPAADVVAAIDAAMPLEPLPPRYRGEVATRWRYRDGSGEVGLIASVSAPFCGDCTRARISAEGKLYTCLFSADGHDLRAVLRSEASDSELRDVIGGIWRVRDDRYSELRTAATGDLPRIEMFAMGG
jgi:cyclic pyranopterin phosphate synthase